MKEIRFHPAAREELLQSFAYYELQQKGLGKRFFASVNASIEKIRAYPLSFRALGEDFRQCRVFRFPYGMIFRVLPQEIQVIALMHLRRSPGYWKARA